MLTYQNKIKINIKISKLYCLLGFILLPKLGLAQHTISGSFPALAGQKVRLVGFEGLGISPIDSVKVSEKGDFILHFTSKDNGMGYLSAADNKASFVVLSNEDIVVKGELLSIPESTTYLSGQENIQFSKYASEHPKREQALSAWDYLNKLYQTETLYNKQKDSRSAIEKEIERIQSEDINFLKNLDSKSYISWFLPIRKLVSSVANIAQNKPAELATTLSVFRNIDYSDNKLYKSGLLKNTIESHYWLLENMGKPLDTVYKEMNVSTDYLINSLRKDEKKFNEITNYLFDLLERHSLFQASEYLALKVLNEGSCTINSELARQLETYRAMKKGNIAPEIIFEKSNFAKQTNSINKLSEIKSKYTVVVFGGSWCPKCKEELPEIVSLYEKWKSKGVEVIFIGLEDDKKIFNDFTEKFPFPSYSDLKKWESKIVNDFYVFSTPTIFLLDNKREIILRPNSVKQMDAWVDWYIKSIP